MTDWKNLNKIKLASCKENFQHHEVVKTLLVMKILERHSNNRTWIRVYTEHELDNGLICDVYYENLKDKSVIIYEIQKNYTNSWIKEKTEKYKKLTVPYMKSVDFIPIELQKLSKNIESLNNQLEEYIF